MAVESLISILADGELHSGREIADNLGISRTAVWKKLQGLEPLGLQVERIRGHGYRLKESLDLLDAQTIRSHLPEPHSAAIETRVETMVGSTNDHVATFPSDFPYVACLAEQQSAGRGRRGRQWMSPFGKNLYLSVGFRLRRGWSGVEGLSLVVGLAVVESLVRLGISSGVALKWPNDVWLNRRKLAGILIELKGEAQSDCRVAVGIGLNVYMQGDYVQGIDQPWSSLAREGVIPEGGKNQLAAVLLAQLMDEIDRFEVSGFEAFRDRWARYDALAGSPLRLLDTGEEGVGRGVDERGAYLVELPQGLRACNSGEVSLRPG